MIYRLNQPHFCGGLTFFADSERVSDKSGLADTNGRVPPDLTFGIDTASVRVARVEALLPNACKGSRALLVIDTFGSGSCKQRQSNMHGL